MFIALFLDMTCLQINRTNN